MTEISPLRETIAGQKALWSEVIGAVKTAAIDAMRIASPYAERYKQLRPVYKVMITTPTEGGYTKHRHILADTSRPYRNFLGKPDSPILGLWVDQSDLSEPDKAIMLMQNPITNESGVLEQDFLNFPQFGVRNWLDIWIGYQPMLTTGVPLYSLGDFFKSKFGVTLPKAFAHLNVAHTLPDTFDFGNDSHVFSGPIVSVKREVNTSGDRLQIIGFSPTVLLKQATTNIDYKVNSESEHSLYDVVNDIASNRIKTFPGNVASQSPGEFYMGRFPLGMFTGAEVNPITGEFASGFRISPVFGSTPDSAWLPVHTNQFADHDDILTKMQAKKLRVGVTGEFSLYKLLFNVLDNAALYGGGGLYASVHRAKIKDGATDQISWAYEDGEGHPGVFVRYGYKFEIKGILDMIKDKTEGDHRYHPNHKQTLTLGRNAREFEGGIEYGTVYNQRRILVRPDGSPRAKEIVFPTDAEFINLLHTDQYKNHKNLWNTILNDILIFGPVLHPTRSWMWGKDGGHTDITHKHSADYLALKLRETYFTGMSGSVFAVGDPSLKPGRVVEIKDERDKLLKQVNSALASGLDKVTRSDKVLKFLGEKLNTGNPTLPEMFRMDNYDKHFYIWKVRHYLGVKSGYVSKVYFVEERNRTWQKYTESIDSIIRKAMVSARFLHGGKSGEI